MQCLYGNKSECLTVFMGFGFCLGGFRGIFGGCLETVCGGLLGCLDGFHAALNLVEKVA